MSSNLRASQLLREAAQLLEASSSTTTTSNLNVQSSTSSGNQVSQLRAATRSLFAPYSASRARGRGLPCIPRATFWSHRFCVLESCSQDNIPTRGDKQRLLLSGLGEKKITFIKSSDPADLTSKLEESFPILKDCGGYELLRTSLTSRCKLEPLPLPPAGYNTEYLADSSLLGQAMCYVRPIQKDLPIKLDSAPFETNIEERKEECLHCGNSIPLRCLREHLAICRIGEDTELQTCFPPPKKPRTVSTRPICGFACVKAGTSIDTALINTKEIPCPICGKKFQSECKLEVHASTCGETTKHRSLEDELERITANVGTGEDKWLINVVRRNFKKTAFQELNDALTSDWERPIKINFVGHPGPKCFNPLVAKFICDGEEPDLANIPDEYVGRKDVLTAIQEISSGSSGYEDLLRIHGDLLEQAGFRQVLSSSTASGAVQALKQHFAYYHVMGPLLQYREGLKLLGIQGVLKNHPESTKFFTASSSRALDVQNFYKPVYTSEDLKPQEEMIMFNFGKFLKKTERGTLSTLWIDPYEGFERKMVIRQHRPCITSSYWV